MPRKKTESRLEVLPGGAGVQSRLNPVVGAFPVRAPSTGLMKLAQTLTAINPAIQQHLDVRRQENDEDAAIKAAEAFDALEEQDRNFEAVVSTSKQLLKDGKIKRGQLPALQRNLKARLGESLADDYRRALGARVEEASRVVDRVPQQQIYSELADEFEGRVPDDFWTQRAFRIAQDKHKEEFERVAFQRSIKETEREALRSRREATFNTLDELAAGDEVDLSTFVRQNYDSEMLNGEAKDEFLSTTKSYVAGLLKDPDNADEAEEVLERVAELKLGSSSLGESGSFKAEFRDVYAAIHEAQAEAPQREARKQADFLNLQKFEASNRIQSLDDETLENLSPSDAVEYAASHIEELENSQGALPDWQKRAIRESYDKIILAETQGGNPDAAKLIADSFDTGNFENAQELLDIYGDDLSANQRSVIESKKANAETLVEYVNDSSLSGYLYAADGIVTDVELLAGEYPFSDDDGTLGPIWDHLTPEQRAEVIEAVRPQAAKRMRDQLQALPSDEIRKDKFHSIMQGEATIYNSRIRSLLQTKYLPIIQENMAKETLEKIEFESLRGRPFIQMPLSELTFAEDVGLFGTGEKVKASNLKELAKVALESPDSTLVKGGGIANQLNTNALETYAVAKAMLGFDAEEILSGESDGIPMDAKAINPYRTAVFKDWNQINEFYRGYIGGSDGRLVEMANALGFTEEDIPVFLHTQRQLLSERASNPNYIKLRQRFNESTRTEQGSSGSSSEETKADS